MGESNLPPTRTPEQCKEAMAKAVHTRRERAAFKAACKAGNIPPEAAIEAPIAQAQGRGVRPLVPGHRHGQGEGDRQGA